MLYNFSLWDPVVMAKILQIICSVQLMAIMPQLARLLRLAVQTAALAVFAYQTRVAVSKYLAPAIIQAVETQSLG